MIALFLATNMSKRLRQSSLSASFKKARVTGVSECMSNPEADLSLNNLEPEKSCIETEPSPSNLEAVSNTEIELSESNVEADQTESTVSSPEVDEAEKDVVENQLTDPSECLSACCSDMSKPYQPTTKNILSSMANNGRNFMHDWYDTFPWLTLCSTKKKAFCFYCRDVDRQGLITFSSKAESAYTTVGFNNWKKAIEKFQKHATCSAHSEAVIKWQMMQKPPVNQQLCTQLQHDQQERQQALLKQLQCLRFLLRQGLAIRGHTETEGNLHQMLVMWSAYDSSLKNWLREKKYLSPIIINEQITIFGLDVLRSLLAKIKTASPAWYAIIADEASDVNNREQLNLSIRWVIDGYEVSEDSIGLYVLPNTTSNVLYSVVTDILTRCDLPLALCRGQAFDGAANMQGKRNGLATKIRSKVPAAVPVHCLAHCLNLCLQDAARKLPFLRDALDTTKELAQLIKFSPKRAHLFSEKLAQSDISGVN